MSKFVISKSEARKYLNCA